MIDPEALQIPGNMAVLRGHAAAITGLGTAFPDTGRRVHSTWQGLAPHYIAPESAQLFAATGPVQTVCASVGEDFVTVGGALSTYADEVEAIQARLAALRSQAREFKTTVVDANPDEWRESEDDVDRHNQMLSEANAAMADYMAAQRRCANAILALYSTKRYVEENGDGTIADNEFGYSQAQLDSALAEDGLPWGSAEEHDRGLLGDVGAFFVGIKDGAVDAVKGLGGLIGYGEDGWSWANAGNAWKGLALFGLSLSPALTILNEHTDLPGIPKGTLGDTLLNAGKGLIAYDTWGEDKSKAAGMATFNIVSAIVGTKGAGAGLRSAGAAAKTSQVGTVARIGTGLVRAGEFIGRAPTVSQVVTSALNRIPGLHLPTISVHGPEVLVPNHVDPSPPAPRVDAAEGTGSGGPSVADGLPGAGGRTDIDPPQASRDVPDLPGTGRPEFEPDTTRPGPNTPDGAQAGPSRPDGADAGPPRTDGTQAGPPRLDGTEPSALRPDGTQPVHTPGTDTPGTDTPGTDTPGAPQPGDPVGPAPEGRPYLPPQQPLGELPPALRPDPGLQPDGSWYHVEHGQELRLSPENLAAANRALDTAWRAEQTISPQIRDVAAGIDAETPGYPDHALKEPDSLKRKVAGELEGEPDLTVDEVLRDKVNDQLRYTMQLPPGSYVNGVLDASADLRARGFELVERPKIRWDDPVRYKGVNMTWYDPLTGQYFEVQFHTPQSLWAKEVTHGIYNEQRLHPKNSPEWTRLNAQQGEIFSTVEVPPGIDRLGNPRREGWDGWGAVGQAVAQSGPEEAGSQEDYQQAAGR
jgi:hypothetical protein